MSAGLMLNFFGLAILFLPYSKVGVVQASQGSTTNHCTTDLQQTVLNYVHLVPQLRFTQYLSENLPYFSFS